MDIHHGTIMVWEAFQNEIIVAADSVAQSSKSGKLNEKVCKIIVLGNNTIFFYTGNFAEAHDPKTGALEFSQYDIARDAYSSLAGKPNSYQRLLEVATKWYELSTLKMEELGAKIEKQSGVKQKLDEKGVSGFAGLDEKKHPRLVIVDTFAREPNATEFAFHPKNNNNVGTLRTVVDLGVYEVLQKSSVRGAQAATKFESRIKNLPPKDIEAERLIAAVEASLEWNKSEVDIGPPVDAVIIERGNGIRWVKRKPSCREHGASQSKP